MPKSRLLLRLPQAAAILCCALLVGLPAGAQPQGASKPRPPAIAPSPEVSLLGTAAPPPLPQGRTTRRAARRVPAPAEPAFPAYTTDPSFRLNNRSGIDLHEIYVSPPAERSWGRDRLGEDLLRPGRFTTIHLPPGQCLNDVRVVFADGQSAELRGVNTCALTDLAFP